MGLSFRIGATESIEPEIKRLVLAGFAGRRLEDVEAHVAEMELQGVARPLVVPTLWPVIPDLVTQAPAIQVFGADTVAEVEYVLFTWGGVTYGTVGNDQCDIAVERHLSAEKSKNLCRKVVAREAWRLDDVLPRWDDLVLTLACNDRIMQQGRLGGLLRPEALLDKVARADGDDRECRMIFSGTIATAGTFPPGPYRIDMSLLDPIGGRTITHAFTVDMLAPLQ